MSFKTYLSILTSPHSSISKYSRNSFFDISPSLCPSYPESVIDLCYGCLGAFCMILFVCMILPLVFLLPQLFKLKVSSLKIGIDHPIFSVTLQRLIQIFYLLGIW